MPSGELAYCACPVRRARVVGDDERTEKSEKKRDLRGSKSLFLARRKKPKGEDQLDLSDESEEVTSRAEG